MFCLSEALYDDNVCMIRSSSTDNPSSSSTWDSLTRVHLTNKLFWVLLLGDSQQKLLMFCYPKLVKLSKIENWYIFNALSYFICIEIISKLIDMIIIHSKYINDFILHNFKVYYLCSQSIWMKKHKDQLIWDILPHYQSLMPFEPLSSQIPRCRWVEHLRVPSGHEKHLETFLYQPFVHSKHLRNGRANPSLCPTSKSQWIIRVSSTHI